MSVLLKCLFWILPADTRHCRTNVTHEGRVAGAPGSHDRHGTLSWLYDYEDDFRINLNYTFFPRKTVDVGRGASGDKTRQDVEQGSILPARADKLLGLHGPNNCSKFLTNFLI